MILVSLIWSFYIHELIHKLSTVRDGYLQYHNWDFRSLRYQHCFDCSLRGSFPETLSKMGTLLWPWADDEYGLQPNNCTSVHNALSHYHPTTFYMHKPHWNRNTSDSGGDHYQLSSWWTLMRWLQCYICCSLSCKRLALAKYVKKCCKYNASIRRLFTHTEQ